MSVAFNSMNEEIDNSSIADLNELSNVKGKLLAWKKCLIWTGVASLIFILGLIVGLVAHPKSGLTGEWVDNVIEVSNIRLTFLAGSTDTDRSTVISSEPNNCPKSGPTYAY